MHSRTKSGCWVVEHRTKPHPKIITPRTYPLVTKTLMHKNHPRQNSSTPERNQGRWVVKCKSRFLAGQNHPRQNSYTLRTKSGVLGGCAGLNPIQRAVAPSDQSIANIRKKILKKKYITCNKASAFSARSIAISGTSSQLIILVRLRTYRLCSLHLSNIKSLHCCR